jgi:hypothetical protein
MGTTINISWFTTTIVYIAGGGTAKLKTTILATVKEAMAAMKEASGLKLEQQKG